MERISRPDAKEPAQDAVDVSNVAKRLAAARAPESIDEAKVARLRAAVSAGTFHIDAHKIADTMVKEER